MRITSVVGLGERTGSSSGPSKATVSALRETGRVVWLLWQRECNPALAGNGTRSLLHPSLLGSLYGGIADFSA